MQSKRLILAIFASLFLTTKLFSQENDESVSPNNIEKAAASRPIVEYALAGGALLAALGIGFMPSKRTKDS